MRYQERKQRLAAPATRKLSEIIIEIAKVGFKAHCRELDPAPKTGHILMYLASQAWNRETSARQQQPALSSLMRNVESLIRELRVSQADLEQELISTNWETILELMEVYKRMHFPADTRQIIACGYTPRGTLRVLWE